MSRKSAPDLRRLKAEGQPIVMCTAYDSWSAALADPVVDAILVGDSVANVCLGLEKTTSVDMAVMSHHLDAVVRGSSRALVVADMPYLSYHVGWRSAVENAGRFIRLGAGAVKLEGGAKRIRTIERLVDAEIPVMGHLGLTPQSVNLLGGYKVKGRSVEEARRIMEDAVLLEAAGCFALVLEGVPHEVAEKISGTLRIPTIGIGAGPACAGQVLVLHDILGLTNGPWPRFVRTYVDGLGVLREGLALWAQDVRGREFPGTAESYSLPEEVRPAVASWCPETKAE